MNDLPLRIESAALAWFGPPSEEDSVPWSYVGEVCSNTDVAAYLRWLEELSREPRDWAVYERYWERFDQDASCVIGFGFKHLLAGSLPDEDRARIAAVQAFEEWAIDRRNQMGADEDA